jgi:hypothetical protein|eukprot:COSAG01_NODE_6485_length_3638_cov_43.071207_1_plen_94_part_00
MNDTGKFDSQSKIQSGSAFLSEKLGTLVVGTQPVVCHTQGRHTGSSRDDPAPPSEHLATIRLRTATEVAVASAMQVPDGSIRSVYNIPARVLL